MYSDIYYEMNNIDVILNHLGWQDGFRIPVANEENKRLEEEVKSRPNVAGSYNFISLGYTVASGLLPFNEQKNLYSKQFSSGNVIKCFK